MKSTNKYRELSINTILFSISSLGTKLIAFLFIPLYTNTLSTGDYGQVDLVTATVQLLIPVLTLNIQDGILRFALEKEEKPGKVLGAGIKLIGVGCVLLGIVLLSGYFWGWIKWEQQYMQFLFWSFAGGAVNNCFTMYLKARSKVRILTVSGLLNTLITCILNVIFLLVIPLGVTGYLIANVAGTWIAIGIMYFAGQIYREMQLGRDIKLVRQMLIYSLPLVVNSLAWWLNNASDRYILTFFCGTAVNGIYAVAYKIPTILSTVQKVFYNAWSISAITEFDSRDRDGFIGNIYAVYSGISYIGCSLIMVANIMLARLLYAKEFFEAWRFVPVLLIGTTFNGIALFEGCIFTAVKKTKEVSLTTLLGAGINTLLNVLLIPSLGAMGAALATMIGYFVIWIVRTCRVLKIVVMKVCWKRQVVTAFLLLVQCILALSENYQFLQIGCALTIVYIQKEVVKKLIRATKKVNY